jgi:predicted AAA+ superfamily ATPase
VRGQVTFFDLERAADAARLATAPEEDLGLLQRRPGLICIDEVQRQPELFALLRPLLDDRRRRARYILLGSASPRLVRGVSESLAGRIGFLDLTPLLRCELGALTETLRVRHWVRGGFPRSYPARSERESVDWREGYFRSFVERDLAALGLELPPVALRRLLTLISHLHGSIVNYSDVAVALGVSAPTARRYIDILEGAFLVRRLPPYYANVGKRLVKSPRLYVRDSGLLHTLLGLSSDQALRAHPKVGASWEGFVVEQIVGAVALANLPGNAFFWRTHAGAEVDLLLQLEGRLVPIEVKLGSVPKVERGLGECMQDLGLKRGFVAYGGDAFYRLGEAVWALPTTLLEDPKTLVKTLLGTR